MAKQAAYDAVVIGGGHNGLICAAYLAKAGKKVAVVERRGVLGGCATTEELWPGYKVSTAAYVVSLLLPEIIQDLKLRAHGLEILPRTPSSFTPLPDGRSLLMGPEPGLNHREISKFSAADAEAFPRYEALLERVASVLEPVLSQTAPDPLPLPNEWRKASFTKKMRDTKKMWSLYQAMAALGEDLPAAVEILTGAARPILDRWFESDALKATLATDAIIGAFLSISSPGSAYVLLHHVMGEAGGARGVWGYIRGGMGALSDAVARSATEMGVEILRETAVSEIHTEGGKVTGVTLSDGSQLDSPVVASSVDANLTYLKLLDSSVLPENFRQAIENIDYASASMKINLALAEPPNFTALPSTGIAPHHHGTMHIGPSLEYIERAYDDAKYGRPSESPVIEMTMASSVDDTIAPPGKHILSCFVQFAPYHLSNLPLAGEGTGSSVGVGVTWDDIKEQFADRCVQVIGEYAPNVPDVIEHRQVLSPVDLERVYGITGGNIMQGAMNANQLFCFRPIAGWADHHSPIEGLYLCGAASHPGGGVMGACGKNAAGEILRDWR
ncbi:NAD(P)/FAD-dependent oxidoreductase [Aeoliella sp. ICT_H6.2]|uniref:Pyridine nucleotide-disulfide oxidoreductase domain-containing protein 2 n=1 Tax=Aeoliella straminimaris TaxID=2954799 RepID=A0A9X2FGA3_9BACT|nr:NAD(P)/FAD-dependent oxidoreductase [Aeoliella straminimaris]MCO6045844.1 NAD(P)/FAD-dependent oxidoreductase [Aeoliella straminimaris]